MSRIIMLLMLVLLLISAPHILYYCIDMDIGISEEVEAFQVRITKWGLENNRVINYIEKCKVDGNSGYCRINFVTDPHTIRWIKCDETLCKIVDEK